MKKPSVLSFPTCLHDLIGFGIVPLLLPIYSKTFGASGWQIGVLMASYSVMQFLFSPVWEALLTALAAGRSQPEHGGRPVSIPYLRSAQVDGQLRWPSCFCRGCCRDLRSEHHCGAGLYADIITGGRALQANGPTVGWRSG
jgi:hypothetical protein